MGWPATFSERGIIHTFCGERVTLDGHQVGVAYLAKAVSIVFN